MEQEASVEEAKCMSESIVGVKPPEWWVEKWKGDKAEYRTEEEFLGSFLGELREMQKQSFDEGVRQGSLGVPRGLEIPVEGVD